MVNGLLRLLTIMLVLTSFAWAKQSAVAEPVQFADPQLAACVEANLVESNTKQLHLLEKLKCHGKGIERLDGLESLTQLQYLSLFNNKLKAVDVSGLTQLTYLNLANNRLQSVKLHGLQQLETLYLFKNKLTHVDFNGLSRLKKLRITNNQLKGIDISELISLEQGYFFDNQLEDLDLSGLANLSFIELRQNPMPDEVYDRYDAIEGITIVHDGNADDWK